MIRMIQRRLIIPRGDTGSFSIPLLTTIAAGDIAVFSIYDQLTHKTVKNIKVDLDGTEEVLTIPFEQSDTVDLQPRKYLWDIRIYNSPIYPTDQQDQIIEPRGLPIDAAEINSYYAAFSLPICEIKEVAEDVPRQT